MSVINLYVAPGGAGLEVCGASVGPDLPVGFPVGLCAWNHPDLHAGRDTLPQHSPSTALMSEPIPYTPPSYLSYTESHLRPFLTVQLSVSAQLTSAARPFYRLSFTSFRVLSLTDCYTNVHGV